MRVGTLMMVGLRLMVAPGVWWSMLLAELIQAGASRLSQVAGWVTRALRGQAKEGELRTHA
jgi:hypothetical protein